MKLLLAILAVLVAFSVYAAFGFYEVAPDEQAVVLRLGRYARTAGPGLQWHAALIEEVERRRVTVTLEEEFGYRTIDPGPPAVYEEQPDEKRMLSGDTNVVNVEFVLQYRISDLARYLFDVEDVPQVVRDVAEAVMREVVAQRPIDDVLTEVKGPIEDEAEQLIQQVLDSYGAGVSIQNVRLQDVEPPDEVKAAFADVVGAEQDRERLILEAQGYADEVVPKARGAAEATLNQAQAYQEAKVLRARGEAERFKALLTEYRKAPQVTRERLYLETLEEILPLMDKVIIEQDQGERVLPYLPLGRRGRQE
jgi:membrane protease subunit HflK